MAIYDISINQFNKLTEEQQKQVIKAQGKLVDVIIKNANTKGTNITGVSGLQNKYGATFKYEKVKAPQGHSNAEYFLDLQKVINAPERSRSNKIKSKSTPEHSISKDASKGASKEYSITYVGDSNQNKTEEYDKFLKTKRYKLLEKLSKKSNSKKLYKIALEKYTKKRTTEYNRLKGRQKYFADKGLNFSLEQTQKASEVYKFLREEGILNVYADSEGVYDEIKEIGADKLLRILQNLKTKDGNLKQMINDLFASNDPIKYAEFDRDDSGIVKSILNK